MQQLKYLIAIVPLFVFVHTIGQSLCMEEIFLQTDRNVYIAGEELFFKCYRFDRDSLKPKSASKYVYLVLRNEKNVLVNGICFKLNRDMFSGGIYLPDTLSTGRYQLVSYTNYMRNFGEDTYFTKEIFVANRFDKDLLNLNSSSTAIDTTQGVKSLENPSAQSDVISIKPEKEKYTRLEKIKIDVEALGLKQGEIAQLSLSVREKTIEQNDIQLNSSSSKPNFTCKYLPETKGIIIEGRVLDAEEKQGIANTKVLLSSPDTVANLQVTKTDTIGNFRFLLNEYYNNKTLVFNLPDNTDGKIVLNEKFDLKKPFQPSPQFSDSSFFSYILKSQNIVQVQKSYGQDSSFVHFIDSKLPSIVPKVNMPQSTVVYPSDFLSLPDFMDVSREIIPRLRTRQRGSTYEARFFNSQTQTYFDQPPMIFLDGVAIQSINQIISLGSDKIRKIEIVSDERYFGGLFFYGILSIYTTAHEIENIKPETASLTGKFMELQPESFLVNSEISKTDRMPDFRQLLYWEPYLSITSKEKKTIEFLASYNKGEYEIVVEGITNTGKLIHAKNFIRIIPKINNK